MSVLETNRPEYQTTVLQSKLSRAAREDRARRFHALHDKLYLPYVLRCAWELVQRNRGAAGLDGETIEDVEAYGVDRFLDETAQAVRAHTYRPQPVRRVLIPKADGRMRPLGIPTVRDRVVQAAAKLILEPIFEEDFKGCSFGFRPKKGTLAALEAVATQSRKGYCWVVEADIVQCFDSLDHGVLMEALRRRIADGAMLRLIYQWLKAGYVWEGKVHRSDRGSPQGGVLSPLLANVYLHTLDEAAQPPTSFLGLLTRYADDFIIQCGTFEQAQRARLWAEEQLTKLKLCLHPEKTRVVEDRGEGFDFLGFHHHRVKLGLHCRKGAGKESRGVLRWPCQRAQAKYRARIRECLGPPGRLRHAERETREALRRFMQGWCQYFRHGESSEVFAELDAFLCERYARTLARSQPKEERRRRRHWEEIAQYLRAAGALPRLADLTRGRFRNYRDPGKAQWRAV